MHSKTSPELLTCRSGVFSTYSRLPRFRGQPSTVLSQCETFNYRTKQSWWSLPSLLLLSSYKTELLKLIYLQDHLPTWVQFSVMVHYCVARCHGGSCCHCYISLSGYKTELIFIFKITCMILLTDLGTILCDGPLLCSKVSWRSLS